MIHLALWLISLCVVLYFAFWVVVGLIVLADRLGWLEAKPQAAPKTPPNINLAQFVVYSGVFVAIIVTIFLVGE